MFQNVPLMRLHFQVGIIIFLAFPLWADPSPEGIKAPPTRPSAEASVIAENIEVLEPCSSEQICVEGQLYNNGSKTAYQVKIHIEIGATKHGRPRMTLVKTPENPTMNPGDRQDVQFTLNRKIPYKNKKGEDKILEVGKFNFKVIPRWTGKKPTTAPSKKRRK